MKEKRRETQRWVERARKREERKRQRDREIKVEKDRERERWKKNPTGKKEREKDEREKEREKETDRKKEITQLVMLTSQLVNAVQFVANDYLCHEETFLLQRPFAPIKIHK